MTILEAAKISLRIKSDIFDEEINELIEACIADLITGGVEKTDTELPLIRQAVKYYCRANFANGASSERELNQKRYDSLKNTLAVCKIYGEESAEDDS